MFGVQSETGKETLDASLPLLVRGGERHDLAHTVCRKAPFQMSTVFELMAHERTAKNGLPEHHGQTA